jgi:hypothetical protein
MKAEASPENCENRQLNQRQHGGPEGIGKLFEFTLLAKEEQRLRIDQPEALQGCEYGQEAQYPAKRGPGTLEQLPVHIRETLLALEKAVGERHPRCGGQRVLSSSKSME